MEPWMQGEVIMKKFIVSRMKRYDVMEKEPVGGGIPEDAKRYLKMCSDYKTGGNK